MNTIGVAYSQHMRSQSQNTAECERSVYTHGARVAREHVERLVHIESARRSEMSRVVADGRLALVLDLDHTLLNSTRFQDLSRTQGEALERLAKTSREAVQLPELGIFTKFRPGVFDFLARVAKIFRCSIYTTGDRRYAFSMAKLLDPDGTIFGDRVISATDYEDKRHKNLNVVTTAAENALVVDDTFALWRGHVDNVIRIDRYFYFPESAASFGRKGRSHVELGDDERDGVLKDVWAALEATHRVFFWRRYARDTRDIIHWRGEVADVSANHGALDGATVLFSGFMTHDDPAPYKHPLAIAAIALGARVTFRDNNASVTHVVAKSPHTRKAVRAMADGKKCVAASWLHACAARGKWVAEREYEWTSAR